MEKKRQGPGQYHTEGQVVRSRHVYTGGLGRWGMLRDKTQKCDMGGIMDDQLENPFDCTRR
ncbi:hypothetical protein KXD40_004503 [Peronospora effusa]|uniref:Uncharacterized protein n=1 Tax=Peronospora effusa TaxID=542832 RepID=A0A3M6V7S0_9STRA|nr:hypothetical protein DD238_006308 [Peronospora effusa]RQM14100.1 hypothetical protein DD237_003611 [Peronospora effusa]UIZ28335.1 hypothetical protein KXD40_004503 [Peronospora effusa]